jgi:hypothetical protein
MTIPKVHPVASAGKVRIAGGGPGEVIAVGGLIWRNVSISIL